MMRHPSHLRLLISSFVNPFLFYNRASAAKVKMDQAAFMCKICRQTFMVNAKPSLLYLHVTAKHPEKKDDPTVCFDALAGFDPDDPDGLKAASAPVATVVKPKKVVKKADDLSLLLDAGLKKGK